MHFEHIPANSSWDHNSVYWRTLGAPWGGLLSSAPDLALFYQAMLHGGALSPPESPRMRRPKRILQPENAALMTRHWHSARRDTCHDGSPASAWGLGFRLQHKELKFGFGSGAAVPEPSTTSSVEAEGLIFGHHGASGAMAWADPQSGLSVAVLTTEPDMCYSAEFNTLCDIIVSDCAS